MNKQQLLLQERFSEKIKFSEEYLNKYGRDWYQGLTPAPIAIFFPENEEDVTNIIDFASKNKLAISLLRPELDIPIRRVFSKFSELMMDFNQRTIHWSKLESFIKEVLMIAEPGQNVDFLKSVSLVISADI